MVEKVSGGSRMSSMKSARKGGGRGSNRHVPRNKIQGSCNTGGSNSLNWRGELKNNVNESNNYGYNNHYLTSVFYTLVGLQVELQKTDGHIYEGILETVSSKLEFHLSLSRKTDSPSQLQENGANREDMSEKRMFPFTDVVYCKAINVDLDFAKRDILLTDNAISGANGPITERELIQWKPEENSPHLETGALDDMNGGWSYDDMMRINEEKHGLKSTFDSSMSTYMTPLEKRDDEEFKEQEKRAEQVAREMQKDSKFKETELLDSGVGEEELFSAVTRNTNTSTNSNNNDGFTTYTGRQNGRGNRGGKGGGQVVGPRLQRNNRTQENVNYSSGVTHQGANRNPIPCVPPRVQNGNAARNTYHQHAPSPGAGYSQDNSASLHNNSRSPMEAPNSAARLSLSYSAVAMKKQPPPPSSNRFNSTSKLATPSQPPIHSQPPIQHLVSENVDTPPQMANNTGLPPQQVSTVQFEQTDMSPDALKNAKEQEIQYTKNYASMVQSSKSPLVSTNNVNMQITTTQTQYTTQVSSPRHNISSPVTTTVLHQSPIQSLHHSPQQPLHQNTVPSPHTATAPSLEKPVQQHSPLKVDSMDRKSVPVDQKSETLPAVDFNTKDVKQPGLMKYGKIHPPVGSEEEKKACSSIGDLKEFSKKFQLSEKPKQTKKTATKTLDVSNIPKPDEKEPSIQSEAISRVEVAPNETSSDVEATSLSSYTTSQSIQITSTVVATSATISSTTVSSTTTSVPTSNSSVCKSVLNPAAKEFTFNPAAREFTPSGSPKPALTKTSSFTGEQQPTGQHSYYHPVHPTSTTPVIVNPHGADVMGQQVQTVPVKPVYPRQYHPSATVFSIPTGEFASNPNGSPQVIAATQSGFIPAHGMPTQPQQFIIVHGPNGTMYQPVVAGPQGQQLVHMQQVPQSQMVRYVTSHPNANTMQQAGNRVATNFQQEGGGAQNSYVLGVNQHGGMVTHPNVPSNQHPSYASSPSPSAHMQPQYMVNTQAGGSYPQITSPISHTQGNTGAHYRPATPAIHSGSVQHHPQQSFVMMGQISHQGQHHPGVTMTTNHQSYIAGQHGGILPNYQQGN